MSIVILLLHASMINAKCIVYNRAGHDPNTLRTGRVRFIFWQCSQAAEHPNSWFSEQRTNTKTHR